MTGREVTIEWRGRRATAWVPDPLIDTPVEADDASTARLSERAAGAVVRLGDRLPAAWEPLARMMLRAEGMASSNIEGLRVSAEAVAGAQMNASGGVAGWVADNLTVVHQALAHPETPLSIATMHEWHDRLMRWSSLPPALIGAFRPSQGWIGGRSPHDAAFVPPPAEQIAALMDDLVVYANRQDVDPVMQAAFLHAQFETIHPYGDGNGRIGRVLVLWLLARRLHVAVPPPLSTMIARDLGGYLSGLHWSRAGEEARWARWFATIVERSATAALEWMAEVEQLLVGWRDGVDDLRADAAGRRLLDLVPAHPVLSTELAAKRLDVSPTAARTALDTLASRGLLRSHLSTPAGPGRPRRLWVADDVLSLVSSWAG